MQETNNEEVIDMIVNLYSQVFILEPDLLQNGVEYDLIKN